MTDSREWAERTIEFLYGPDDRNNMDEIRSGLEAIFEQHATEVQDAAEAEIEIWRGKLAEQCGHTLAAKRAALLKL